jgi:hypothetical protein
MAVLAGLLGVGALVIAAIFLFPVVTGVGLEVAVSGAAGAAVTGTALSELTAGLAAIVNTALNVLTAVGRQVVVLAPPGGAPARLLPRVGACLSQPAHTRAASQQWMNTSNYHI